MERVLLLAPRRSSRFGDTARAAAFRAGLAGMEVVSAPRMPEGRGVLRVGPLLEAIRGSDALVFAGPLCHVDLQDGTTATSDLAAATAACAYAHARGRCVAMVGVGAGELPRAQDRVLARGLVRRCDLLVLRDEESGQKLHRAGAPKPFRIGAEPSWILLDEVPERASPGDGVTLVVDDYPVDVPVLAHALDALASAGFDIALQPCVSAPEKDPGVASAIGEAMRAPARILPEAVDLPGLRDALRSTRVAIATSVAGVVAAAASGARMVAFEGEPGTAALAHRLDFPAAPPHPGAVAAVAADAAGAPPPSPAGVRKQIAYAEESFRLLRVLVQRGRSAEAEHVYGLPLGPEPW